VQKTLYISSLGMSEPLGQSQVLEYLRDLSDDFEVFLYSFEKDITDTTLFFLQRDISASGIQWYYQLYSNRYGVFSTLFQIISSYTQMSRIVKQNSIRLIHARSLVPTLIALMLKKRYGLKVVFDIRGFQVDEKAEVGRIKKSSLLYKILKWLEHYAYKHSDAIVTLTYTSIAYISDFVDKDKITVIPTCANKELFKRVSKENRDKFKSTLGYRLQDKILLHVGAVSNWYDFDSELKVVSQLMKQNESLHYLIINKSEHDFIYKKVKSFEIDLERLKVLEVDFYDIYKYLNIADASIFIIKPTFSKKASAPTKFAENLACGLYSITNNGIGDMDMFVKQNRNIGYSFEIEEIEKNLDKIVKEILYQLNQKKDLQEYDEMYNKFFTKEIAIERYKGIYKGLLK